MDLAPEAFLLAWDGRVGMLRGGPQHAHLMAAAQLLELQAQGAIEAAGEHPAPSGAAGATGAGAELLLRRISREKPRTWRSWISRAGGPVHDAVRAELAERDVITLEARMLRSPRVTVRDPRPATAIVERARAAVLGVDPLDEVPSADIALGALAALAQLPGVFTDAERRQHHARVRELVIRTGPAAEALRDELAGRRMARIVVISNTST